MATPILLTIDMYIEMTRFLEVGLPNAKYDLEKKICKKCISANQGNIDKIKKVMAADNSKNNNKEDLQEKNK